MSAPDAQLAEEEQALVDGAGASVIERDVVRVDGPDAVTFLQGQLSQDVEGHAIGVSRLSFLLQPQGKLDALVRVTRTGDEAYLLDTDGGFGEAVMARLNRFKLRVKCELTLLPWRVIAVRGAAAERNADVRPSLVALDSWWPAWPGYDLAGTDAEVPDAVKTCRAEAFEATRIALGAPRMGVDLDERTIPAESGLVELAASFTKGCYTGQELVARIDSRGHVNRHLRRLSLDTAAVPPRGAAIRAVVGGSDREVGSVTSAALSARLGHAVALGYVRREVEPPAEVVLTWQGGRAGARVEP